MKLRKLSERDARRPGRREDGRDNEVVECAEPDDAEITLGSHLRSVKPPPWVRVKGAQTENRGT